MFSYRFVSKQFKIFVFIIVVTGMVFIPKMTHAAVQKANLPTYNVVSVSNVKTKAEIVLDDTPSQAMGEITGIQLSESVRTTIHDPEDWQLWDIVPSMSQTALSIYTRGLAMGNNPQAFSKVGDGEISAEWFLTDFDLGTNYYNLGPHLDLQNSIVYFAGSFGRQSQSARRGFNTQKILDPSMANTEFCLGSETALNCEIRLHRPSFALVSMGTNQVWQPEQFESGMRSIIETLIGNGVVPILSTKADNLEGDNGINLIVAGLAAEYDIPLWNFWRAAEALTDHGLQRDNEHLTYFPNDFSDPAAMEFAWPVRNLSALQVLDALRKGAVR